MSNLQFGLFGICDGHGGDRAARSASKLVFSDLALPCLMSSDFSLLYTLICGLSCTNHLKAIMDNDTPVELETFFPALMAK